MGENMFRVVAYLIAIFWFLAGLAIGIPIGLLM